MQPPVFWPWDPRQQLPPGQRTGVNGVEQAWANLVAVFTQVLPAAWDELSRLV